MVSIARMSRSGAAPPNRTWRTWSGWLSTCDVGRSEAIATRARASSGSAGSSSRSAKEPADAPSGSVYVGIGSPGLIEGRVGVSAGVARAAATASARSGDTRGTPGRISSPDGSPGPTGTGSPLPASSEVVAITGTGSPGAVGGTLASGPRDQPLPPNDRPFPLDPALPFGDRL